MNHEHYDIEELSRYFLNRMSPEEETALQEHLEKCPKCRKSLADLRTLHAQFSDIDSLKESQTTFVKVVSSFAFRVAAIIIVVVIVGVALFKWGSSQTRNSLPTQMQINEGKDPKQVFDIDSCNVSDTLMAKQIIDSAK